MDEDKTIIDKIAKLLMEHRSGIMSSDVLAQLILVEIVNPDGRKLQLTKTAQSDVIEAISMIQHWADQISDNIKGPHNGKDPS